MGVVYRLDPHGRLSVVYSFSGLHDGANPSTIMQHTDGKLYGFTGDGGSYSEGTFFSIDLGLRPFVSLVSMFGKPGDTIGILGQGFDGTTAVAFNGIAATFTVVSDTYLTATVPEGATTGFVTVKTPDGKLTSNRKFVVTE